jgi:hypothetical protein
LRPNREKPLPPVLWSNWRKSSAAGFEAKPAKTVAVGFEAKPLESVQVDLRPNHSQTVDLGFMAQLRNSRSSSPRARCRPHTAPPDLSTAQPPSIWPVQPSPVLCTRSPTPVTVLVATHHAAPSIGTPREKQTRFSKRNKDKRKTKQNYPGFEFKPHQVNDSSQSNQGMNHLVSQVGTPESPSPPHKGPTINIFCVRWWVLPDLWYRLLGGRHRCFLCSMVGAPRSSTSPPRGPTLDVFHVEWWTLLDL